MTFAIITWDVNPEIFRIGNFAVRWYGLLFASGFLFGYLLFQKMFKNEGLKKMCLTGLLSIPPWEQLLVPAWAIASFMSHLITQ